MIQVSATRDNPSHQKQHSTTLMSTLESVLCSVCFWWVVCLSCAALLAFSSRHFMNPDGLSYLDMASEALQNGPLELLNGYWSPAYPAFLGIGLALFRPSAGQEFPLVHFLNFLLFVLTLGSFHFFWRRWMAYMDAFAPLGDQARRIAIPFAFCSFAWFILKYIGLVNATPDLALAAVIFTASGIICRLSLPNARNIHFAALGLVLGLGYYTKAAMLVLGLLLLGWLFIFPTQGVTRRKVLLALLVFLISSAPLALLLSSRVGRLSFGETGRLNYAWYVNGLQLHTGWTGGSSNPNGTPEHPPRIVARKPLTLEFGSPIKGTFPLWYDPAYWYAGAKTYFDLRQQLAALKGNVAALLHIARATILITGAMLLLIFAICEKRLPSFRLRGSWLLIWPLSSISTYLAVFIADRYIGAFLVLLGLAVYGSLLFLLNRRTMALCLIAIALLLVPITGRVVWRSAHSLGDLIGSKKPDYEAAATELQNLGFRNGDSLALVGYPFDPYYARYLGLRIVAQIPAESDFWNLSPPELASAAGRLRQIGVKAIIAKNRPDTSSASNWRDIRISDSLQYSVLLLSKPD